MSARCPVAPPAEAPLPSGRPGAADSESSYLVEGQDTENISGGYSKANVPMEFIQDVDIKTSGVEAEYGGALGGVINVILKKGVVRPG